MERIMELAREIFKNERDVDQKSGRETRTRLSTARRCASLGRDGYEGPWEITTFLLPTQHIMVFMVMSMAVAVGWGRMRAQG